MTVLHNSPIGTLQITVAHGHVTEVDLATDTYIYITETHQTDDHDMAIAKATCIQLDEYFAGLRTDFELPLKPAGTAFQQRVYAALRTIPYGTTVSYGHIAHAIGQPRACQAVGQAVGSNPLLILIPCHRVIAANGNLGGFSCGPNIKRQLLNLENPGRVPLCMTAG